MRDTYIDRDETQVYGAHATKMIRERVVGLVPAADAYLLFLAEQVDTATVGVKTAVDGSRSADAAKRAGSTAKKPVLGQARELLSRFSSHLDGHPKGVVDRKVFFTQDGTASGVPGGASHVLLALATIAEQLGREDCPVRDRAAWLEEFTSTMTALGTAVGHSADARTDRREATPVVEAARLAWLNAYYAARSGVESVLRLTGKLDLLPEIFKDLAVPSKPQDPGDPKLL